MYLQYNLEKIFGVHGDTMWDLGKFREDLSTIGDEAPEHQNGCAMLGSLGSGSQAIYLKVPQDVPPIFQSFEANEEFC